MMATLEMIEVAEGRWLAVDCATAGDLEAAQATTSALFGTLAELADHRRRGAPGRHS